MTFRAKKLTMSAIVRHLHELPGRTPAIRQLVLQASAPVIAKALGYHDKTVTRLVTEAAGIRDTSTCEPTSPKAGSGARTRRQGPSGVTVMPVTVTPERRSPCLAVNR